MRKFDVFSLFLWYHLQICFFVKAISCVVEIFGISRLDIIPNQQKLNLCTKESYFLHIYILAFLPAWTQRQQLFAFTYRLRQPANTPRGFAA